MTSAEELGTYGAADCGAYVANFMLVARALGVANIAQAALASHSAFVRSHLGLAAGRQVVCGIPFGFADKTSAVNTFRTGRAAIAEVATFVDN